MVAVGPIPRREYRKDWLWRVDRGDNAVEQSVARELAAGSRSWCYLGLGYGGGVSRESSHGGSQRKHGGTHFAGLERKRRRSVAVIDRRNRRERGQWPGPVHETLSRPRYSFFFIWLWAWQRRGLSGWVGLRGPAGAAQGRGVATRDPRDGPRSGELFADCVGGVGSWRNSKFQEG